jgi:L-Lysine epsilon oxidase N-terminal/L-lysine epsilon oxidase C-terminal domain
MSNAIVKALIYPAVGIARVGNAPAATEEDYFIGPEVSGQVPNPPGGFKDKQGRVKKQAARFRIYGLDADGNVVQEITAADAKINWRVHIANRKAGWYMFNNALDLQDMAIPSSVRNADIADRSKLIIDPGSIAIDGTNTSGPAYHFDKGAFMDIPVPLGELRTDEAGRLIVLGGDGHSASYTNAQAITFANNDTWHDDISDGPVRATVTLADGTVLEAEPAMVAVTPPNFGQGLYGAVSMYDVVYNMTAELGWIKKPTQPDFWEHIYPVLSRMTQTQWVNQGFFMVFGQNSPSDFTQAELLKQLSSNSPADEPLRRRVFNWFRNPAGEAYTPAKLTSFYGDGFGEYEDIAIVNLSVTNTQYEWLANWADGNFSTNQPPVYQSLEEVPLQEQPHMLTKTNLDDCLGGPFHPGIELTWPMRVPQMWKEAFRLNIMAEDASPQDDWGPLLSTKIVLQPGGALAASGPGTLTRWLGVPWQTDEASCLSGYDASTYLPLPSFWAARVPNQVLSMDSFKRLSNEQVPTGQRLKHFDYRQDWLRDFGTSYVKKINAMVAKWHNLGIIVQHNAEAGKAAGLLPAEYWVETGRQDFETTDPTFEQVVYAENIGNEAMPQQQLRLKSTAESEAPKRERKTVSRGER